ncbi:hypothetical protein MPNT_430003 [Candidatus Methylacidithermus pantelleriae]|uniref:Uncharacterized protein n=1 Tax=Candidatus Methylacidithermus pantelleriae TaxID=2744239 RepID=A0A8J2BMC4_9BACT|nr:hypothetical protein MPNT_430003 [Candidatus Methylacidithermus pantelleriae]
MEAVAWFVYFWDLWSDIVRFNLYFYATDYVRVSARIVPQGSDTEHLSNLGTVNMLDEY